MPGKYLMIFYLPNIVLDFPEISYGMLERHIIVIIDLKIWKAFAFQFCCIFAYFWVFRPFTLKQIFF